MPFMSDGATPRRVSLTRCPSTTPWPPPQAATHSRTCQEWTMEEFEAAMRLLPEVLDALVREIKKLQNAKG